MATTKTLEERTTHCREELRKKASKARWSLLLASLVAVPSCSSACSLVAGRGMADIIAFAVVGSAALFFFVSSTLNIRQDVSRSRARRREAWQTVQTRRDATSVVSEVLEARAYAEALGIDVSNAAFSSSENLVGSLGQTQGR